MKKKIIHVNKHHIASNIKHSTNKPAITVKTYNSNDYGHTAIIKDKDGNEVARVVHKQSKPKSCGARVWIETYLDVEVINQNVKKEE